MKKRFIVDIIADKDSMPDVHDLYSILKSRLWKKPEGITVRELEVE